MIAGAMERDVQVGEAERERILRMLQRNADELRLSGVRRLRLTGSIARGEATRDSDVDLIAEIDRSEGRRFSLLDLAGLELDLSSRLGRDVQITALHDGLNPTVRAAMEADAIDVLGDG
jgi:predicted nucleotidyltransferase